MSVINRLAVAPHSQTSMGRLLIDELQQAASLVDFKEMLNRSAALTKFAKQLPTSAILLDDLKVMVKGDTLHCLLAIETLAVIEDESVNALLVECLAHTDASVRRQVTWKLSERNLVAPALPQLVQQLCSGWHRYNARPSNLIPLGKVRASDRLCDYQLMR